jgi:hypothetical protein
MQTVRIVGEIEQSTFVLTVEMNGEAVYLHQTAPKKLSLTRLRSHAFLFSSRVIADCYREFCQQRLAGQGICRVMEIPASDPHLAERICAAKAPQIPLWTQKQSIVERSEIQVVWQRKDITRYRW